MSLVTDGRVPVPWITGLAGVGKSTVSWQISTDLARAGIHIAFADADQFCMCYPAPPGKKKKKKKKKKNRVTDAIRLVNGRPALVIWPRTSANCHCNAVVVEFNWNGVNVALYIVTLSGAGLMSDRSADPRVGGAAVVFLDAGVVIIGREVSGDAGDLLGEPAAMARRASVIG